jgi:hypothetical protein
MMEITAEDLNTEDPELFVDALRGLWDRIEVSPGRGLGIGQRVRFVAPGEPNGSTLVANA